MDNLRQTCDKHSICNKKLTSFKVKSKLLVYVIETGKNENIENAAWFIKKRYISMLSIARKLY